MKHRWKAACFGLLLLGGCRSPEQAVVIAVPAPPGQELPEKAVQLLQRFESASRAIQNKAEQEVQVLRDLLIAELRPLQEEYTRAGRLDEAVAIRASIRRLKAIGGQIVEVEWGGRWWPAKVLETDGDRYYVRYVGYSEVFDEWVPRERIRFQGVARAW